MRTSGFVITMLAVFGVQCAGNGQQPNIVVIVADDLGWNDVGYHNAEIRTPVIDRLARTGIELDCHYVTPQCTPTRVALLTGRYPSRFGSHCTQASNQQAIPKGTQTLASWLRKAGYDTALMGKWHMGSKPEWGPNHFGFNYSYGSLAGAVGMYDHRYRLNQTEFARTWHRNHDFVEQVGHATDLVTDEAVAWLKRSRKEPFFLYLPYHSVHVPLVEPQVWIAANNHITAPDRRLFAAAVSHLDASVGRIVTTLEEIGQRASTIIVFTSDNGGLHDHGGDQYPPPDPALRHFSSNLPLRGQKATVYEGGIRVPAFVNWPGHFTPARMDAPMHVVDWFPTLLQLVDFPAQPADRFDGLSILPLLVPGPAPPPGERTFYWVWGADRQRIALRYGQWKVLRNEREADFELYDLSEDASEQRDLAQRMPDKLAEMVRLLQRQAAEDALHP